MKDYQVKIHNILMMLVFLSIVDGFTTWYILVNGGTEMNPMMGIIIGVFGIVGGVVISRLLHIAVILRVWDEVVKGGLGRFGLMLLGLLFYICVVSMNIYEIVSHLG